MTGKSALVGILMVLIGSGCVSSDYKKGNDGLTDNITKTDNASSSRSYIGFWPLLFSRFSGSSSPAAVERETQNNAAQQDKERKSDLKARGSKSFSGSFGS